MAITIYWRDVLTNLLSPGSDGIVIVFENECNPTFSFQVNGPDVDYLGRGDFHDSKYNSMEIGVCIDLNQLPLSHNVAYFRILTIHLLTAPYGRPGCWTLWRFRWNSGRTRAYQF
jgi:hypothetical protein